MNLHLTVMLLVLTQTTKGATATKSIEELAIAWVTEQGVPGLTVAAVAQTDEGLQIWSDAYGYSNVARQEAMTADTPLWLGSLSKAVVGTTILKAQEQGYLRLDSRVVDILQQASDFSLGDNQTSARLANITLEDLATHRSTILDQEDIYNCAYFVGDRTGEYQLLMDLLLGEAESECIEDSPVTLGGYLEAYLSEDGAYFDPKNNFIVDANPGKQKMYSNIGAGLAGYLVGLATKMTLPAYASQHIFEPLKMEHTSFLSSDLDQVATPYTKLDKGADYEELPLYDLATFPDGGLRSSANDMARFLGTIMNQGTYTGKKGKMDDVALRSSLGQDKDHVILLQPESVEEMLRLRYDDEFAVFWTTAAIPFKGQSRVLMGHDGSDPGAFSFMFFDPETATGFFLAGNGDDESADVQVVLDLMEALMVRADDLAHTQAAPSTDTSVASSTIWVIVIMAISALFAVLLVANSS